MISINCKPAVLVITLMMMGVRAWGKELTDTVPGNGKVVTTVTMQSGQQTVTGSTGAAQGGAVAASPNNHKTQVNNGKTPVMVMQQAAPLNKLDEYVQKDSLTKNAYRNLQVNYYESLKEQNTKNTELNDSIVAHQKWALNNQEQAILNQQDKGGKIFILVVIVVCCGLIFSGIQFYIAMRGALEKLKKGAATAVQAKTANAGKDEGKPEQTTIKITLQGIEISSSIIGLIILAMSIAFFYLYLHQVFPINLQKVIELQAETGK